MIAIALALAVVPNSIGTLCFGGEIGRFIGPGQVGTADASRRLLLEADPRRGRSAAQSPERRPTS